MTKEIFFPAIRILTDKMTRAVAEFFPEDIKISSPKSGLCLWVELNPQVDSLQFLAQAASHNISIVPGLVCLGAS